MELTGKLKFMLDFLWRYDIIVSATQDIVCDIF